MDQRTPDDLDAVALGLKRGPRGAVALVLIGSIAVVGGTLATRVSIEEQAPIFEDELVALPTLPSPPPSAKKLKVKKGTPSLSGRGVGVRERKLAPSPEQPKPIIVEQAKPEEQKPAPVEVARVEEPLTLPPPPPPAPEPEEEVVAKPEPVAPAPVAVVDEPSAPIEVDGNGAAIAKLIAASKRAAVRSCFESELKQTPKLRGTVVVELDLAPPNKVTGVRVNDDLDRPAFTRCVRNTMQTIRFTGLDEELSVSVPYNLTPQSK
ncbi:MAG: AgmX/PglI C-terminal domain-containing protein [Archangium sp.]|nr:AgmX/PglI C-terminal domain-containing protein [Archangium sp.]